MSNVSVLIGGRTYSLACADGEEAHVVALGQLIDAKVGEAGVVGQSEARMLLFAALMLADEIHELRKSREGQAGKDAQLAQSIDAIANRIEKLADALETGLESEPLNA